MCIGGTPKVKSQPPPELPPQPLAANPVAVESTQSRSNQRKKQALASGLASTRQPGTAAPAATGRTQLG